MLCFLQWPTFRSHRSKDVCVMSGRATSGRAPQLSRLVTTSQRHQRRDVGVMFAKPNVGPLRIIVGVRCATTRQEHQQCNVRFSAATNNSDCKSRLSKDDSATASTMSFHKNATTDRNIASCTFFTSQSKVTLQFIVTGGPTFGHNRLSKSGGQRLFYTGARMWCDVAVVAANV